MDGYAVMPMADAAKIGELFVTLTGNKHVVRPEHFKQMKDGAIVANSGHFDVEIDTIGLKKMAKKVNRDVRRCVDEFVMKNDKSIYLLAQGRLINLAAAEGHPASVMDMSFATQALATEFAIKNSKKLKPGVYEVPEETEKWISAAKLKSMSISIDELTPEQAEYLASSGEGT